MDTKVYHGIQRSPPPLPIQSQIDQVHAPQSHFFKIYFNIIFSSTPGWKFQYKLYASNMGGKTK